MSASNVPESAVLIDLSAFEPAEYFREYHYFEKFDTKKAYAAGSFKKDYGKGEHCYRYKLYTFRSGEKYIVAEEDLSKADLKQLIPYCQCLYHRCEWYDLTRYFIDQDSVGCLESSQPGQWVINESRKYMKVK